MSGLPLRGLLAALLALAIGPGALQANGYYDFSNGDQHGLGPDGVVVVGYDKATGDFYPASEPGGVPLKR